ncbi:MAG: hypothetical protein WB284_03810 [Methanoregula sp.]
MVKQDEIQVQKACNKHPPLCSDYHGPDCRDQAIHHGGGTRFTVAAVALLVADRIVENQNLKKEEEKGK